MESEPAVKVRAAREDDLELLPVIQIASGTAFREIGMVAIADAAPLPGQALADYQQAGHAWVAVTGADIPIGFIVVDLIDGRAHIEQVSVHPDHARRGIGGRLIDHAGHWAAAQGIDALTLSTFRTVPWNGPYYARLGFRDMEPGEITPGLAAVLDNEAAHGIDPATRVCMWRATAPSPVDPPPTGAERAMLEGWLDFHRTTLLAKCDGLNDQQRKHRPIATSLMSLHGLMRHTADVERNWFQRAIGHQPDMPGIYLTSDNTDADWAPLDDADWGADVAIWQEECERSRQTAAAHSLDDTGTGLRGGQYGEFSLRWVYNHMIEEYAQHNGHADLIREMIDGRVSD